MPVIQDQGKRKKRAAGELKTTKEGVHNVKALLPHKQQQRRKKLH
jgi:hypothetical protein